MDERTTTGPPGPRAGGPCSTVLGLPRARHGPECDLDDDSRFIEFYNLVFMEFSRAADTTTRWRARTSTPAWAWSMAQILQDKPNNYETI